VDLIFNAVLPVFAIILLGYLAGRFKILNKDAGQVLTRFVYYFALPLLFFLATATTNIHTTLNWPFIAAFSIAMFGNYFVSALYSIFILKDSTERWAIRGLSVGSPNVSFMGIAILWILIGKQGVLVATVAAILTILLMLLAIIIIEIARGKNLEDEAANALKIIFHKLITNPLLIAAVLGALYSLTGWQLAKPITVFCNELSRTVGPCALFAIGLNMLGEKIHKGDAVEIIGSCFVLKLIVQPLIMLGALFWLNVQPLWAVCGLIITALPCGAFAFILAHKYQVFQKESSALIISSTVISIFTLTAMLFLARHFWPGVLPVA
jgi:predicted permease